MRDMRITRTILAVPAHRESMVTSAAASSADAVFLDLEDAVPPASKHDALLGAVAAIQKLNWGKKTVCVRTNTVIGQTFEDELAMLCSCARLDTVLIPKFENPAGFGRIEALIKTLSPTNRDAPIGIEVLIETALGVVNVDAIAAGSPLLEALHFGVGDFSASIGARNLDIGESPLDYCMVTRSTRGLMLTPMDLWAYPMMRILIAARAYQLRAIDGPCGAYRDLELTRAGASKAAAMGFDGKHVIHPNQISGTRQAFIPSAPEVLQAQQTISATKNGQTHGLGAIEIEGRLLDEASVRMARRILLLAERDE